MEIYLLEYLVAFYHTGTVEAASKEMNVTAPTISRGLKKLESSLGIELFSREPKKISLNQTGVFAAQKAEQLLKQLKLYQDEVLGFYRAHDELRVTETAWGISRLLEDYPEEIALSPLPVSEEQAQKLLLTREAAMAVTTAEYSSPELESVFLGRDRLEIKVTKYNQLYEKSSVSFSDLAGQEFVLRKQLGVWTGIIESNAPKAMLIYQDTQEGLNELIRYSNFPIFSSRVNDLFSKNDGGKRKALPITDDSAQIELYATYLKANRRKLQELIRYLSKRLAAN
ncbi:transcriptional regulator [Lactobacillus nasalidis]|uniref:Transcriptional regulator n=1 Tax=Lactobacillus nasalidis TaxID=2797258 RepID=A0ABQ3W7A7_9LACO|nr:LysR family transcriptional regulator [Lactobacillus nasalidis]GHV97529.1 transcriptional regulator [Lactobacillus nasalidis]GHV99425.1 transcriptional regulator [Lactobacillus nasalidis]GHW01214.1 transcriptional regulator [Lactobacillus nasalidis]